MLLSSIYCLENNCKIGYIFFREYYKIAGYFLRKYCIIMYIYYILLWFTIHNLWISINVEKQSFLNTFFVVLDGVYSTWIVNFICVDSEFWEKLFVREHKKNKRLCANGVLYFVYSIQSKLLLLSQHFRHSIYSIFVCLYTLFSIRVILKDFKTCLRKVLDIKQVQKTW